jgi:hypothetical protein
VQHQVAVQNQFSAQAVQLVPAPLPPPPNFRLRPYISTLPGPAFSLPSVAAASKSNSDGANTTAMNQQNQAVHCPSIAATSSEITTACKHQRRSPFKAE